MKTKPLGLFLALLTIGLRLPVAPLLAGDTAKVLAALPHGPSEGSVNGWD